MRTALTFGWDPGKSTRNEAERSIPFEEARRFEFAGAMIVRDERMDYGEERWVATGFVGERLHILVYTVRPGSDVWVISLRKANRREVRRYVHFIEDRP